MVSFQSSVAFQGEEHRSFCWEVSGSRRAALLVHGFPGSPAEMHSVAQIIHRLGWTVEGVLLPGFGPDLETMPYRRMEDWLSAVYQSLDSLRSSHDTVVLVGHSMGAALVMMASMRCPIDGLILFAPFWRVRHFLWDLLPFVKLFFPQPRIFRHIKLNFSDPEVREGIYRFLPGIDLDDPQVQRAILDFRLPISMFDQVRRVGVGAFQVSSDLISSALVFQGNLDQLVRPDDTRFLLGRFRTPAEYIVLDGAEHDLLSADLPFFPQVESAIVRYLGRWS